MMAHLMISERKTAPRKCEAHIFKRHLKSTRSMRDVCLSRSPLARLSFNATQLHKLNLSLPHRLTRNFICKSSRAATLGEQGVGVSIAAVVEGSRSLRREPPVELVRATHKRGTRKIRGQALRPSEAIPTGPRPDVEAVMVLALELI